jgi:hypothetical protein
VVTRRGRREGGREEGREEERETPQWSRYAREGRDGKEG